MGCSYCSIHIISGKRIRHRPTDDVIRELKTRRLLDGNPHLQVTFTNDTFGTMAQDRALLRRLKTELDGRPFAWLTQIGLGALQDEGLLELINSVGQSTLIIGVESPFREGLSTEKNGITSINPMHVFEKIRRYPNIRTRLLLMVGFDFEPRNACEQMLDFIKQIQPDGVYISILTPFPGTPIGEKLDAEGRIFDRNWAHYDTRHLVFERRFTSDGQRLGIMTSEEFMRGFQWLVAEAETAINRWSRFETASSVL
jgi:radical SAM superfamily enzyme YgiQ (UPF0313 family)